MPADSQTDHSVYTQVQSVHMAAKCVYSSCCRVLCYNQCVYITMTEHDGVEYTHPACCLHHRTKCIHPTLMFIQHDAGVYTSDLSNSPDVAVYTILHAVCEVLCVRFRRFQWFQRCPATHGHAPPTHWLPPTRSGSTHALLPRPRRCRSAP